MWIWAQEGPDAGAWWLDVWPFVAMGAILVLAVLGLIFGVAGLVWSQRRAERLTRSEDDPDEVASRRISRRVP